MSAVCTKIIRIGNSQGIRIPKLLLDQLVDQLDLGDEVELEVQDNQLIVRPLAAPRRNWEAQFQAMAARGDDQLLDAEAANLTAFDQQEWEW